VCDAEGRSPFWDAVGRRFFNMEYPQAEQLSGGRSKTFIAELMPQYPIYVPLLPPAAQLAIGQLHPDGELPFSILIDEGFEPDIYIDIFDGGPTVEARVDTLRSIRQQRRLPARVYTSSQTEGAMKPNDGNATMLQALVSNTRADRFRATLATVRIAGDEAHIEADVAAAIDVADGEALRVVALEIAPGAD
jgi:arginine N-succinyltransferase